MIMSFQIVNRTIKYMGVMFLMLFASFSGAMAWSSTESKDQTDINPGQAVVDIVTFRGTTIDSTRIDCYYLSLIHI